MRTNPIRFVALRLALCALLFSASPLTAVAPSQVTAGGDAVIKTQIEARLVDKDIIGVGVEVHDHVATLTGSVASLWIKQQALEHARKVRGVTEVISLLTIVGGERDSGVALEIAEDIGASSYYSVFDSVTVRVSDGVATLNGYVTTGVQSHEFTRVASKVPGVREVINLIETLPPSMNDDYLRQAIASAIYGRLLPQYLNARNGPVHIIVKMGRVTLTGSVGSEVDRRMAEVLARDVFGVMAVDNELTVDLDTD
jgi:osmotically-inducible protein OsmY